MLKYTEEIIKGEMYKIMLPNGVSLVLEGGGMRGFYSAGVLDAFLEAGIMFPYIIAVSAGAANALSYIAGQKGRNRIIVEKYVGTPEYFGIRNLIFKRSLFNFNYIFEEVAKKHLFFDREIFNSVKTRLLTGATDCKTGKTVWFEKEELGDWFKPTVASCSIPVISKIVKIDDYALLDGGMSSPIPIEKSLDDGNKFHVIILTRNKGYAKKPFKLKTQARIFYAKYPNIAEVMEKRPALYNEQIKLCEKLEEEGKAIIIRPEKELEVERLAKDTTRLVALYDEGIEEGRKAVAVLMEKLKTMNNE